MMKLVISLLLFASSLFASDLDSLLNAQRTRAGVRADTLFSAFDQATESERADVEFLLAYLPLADLAYMTGDDILENVRLAQQARREFSWGAQLTDELYTHFVLPHRVSQEPFVHWREQFYETLAPRVKNLSMTEAALEMNLWCREVATYKPSDGRDQDPLTTIRAGYGRCEEEMILAICALRSVGIPARACHTPFWAHMDDNHAWVEVWTDGQWHYFGACEPEPALNQAWFTNAAARAMLVVSTAYGDYHGPEPVLKRYGNCTLINSTAVYGETRTLNVRLLDAKGKPARKSKVFFNLYNYGTFLPSLVLETDDNGKVSLVCGPGDWFVTAGDDEHAVFSHIKANESTTELRLTDSKDLREFTEADFSPPPIPDDKSTVPRDSLFSCRVTVAESLWNENAWTVWAREAGTYIAATVDQARPDSEWVYAQSEKSFGSFPASADSLQHQLLEIMQRARGNWGNLWKFLTKEFPGRRSDSEMDQAKLLLLTTLSEKDCRDFGETSLWNGTELTEEIEAVSNIGVSYARRVVFPEPISVDINSDLCRNYILCPRLSYEPSRPWQQHLRRFAQKWDSPEKCKPWLLSNITIEEQKDRLGPPLTPAECLLLRRGAQDDLERLYLGFMRVNGVPARFNPVNMQPEIWEEGEWKIVNLKSEKTKSGKAKTPRTGKLELETTADTMQYNKTWGMAKWDKDHFSDLDFGYMEPFSNIEWPQELAEGLYCLTSGIRASDGSVPIHVEWFEIKPGKTTKVELKFRDTVSPKQTETFNNSRQE